MWTLPVGPGEITNGWQTPWMQAPPRQSRPHLPQLFVLAARSASQPLAGFLSQSAYDATHTGAHVPFVHAAAAWSACGHTFPHTPQLFGSLASFAQLPEHIAVPAWQK